MILCRHLNDINGKLIDNVTTFQQIYLTWLCYLSSPNIDTIYDRFILLKEADSWVRLLQEAKPLLYSVNLGLYSVNHLHCCGQQTNNSQTWKVEYPRSMAPFQWGKVINVKNIVEQGGGFTLLTPSPTSLTTFFKALISRVSLTTPPHPLN